GPPQAFAQRVDPGLALVAGLAEAPDGDAARPEVVQHDGFGIHVCRAGVRHLRGDLQWDGGDAVAVAVEQVAGVDGHAADVDREVDGRDVAVPVRADGAAGEAGELEALDLVEVAAGTGRDEAGGPEGLVGRAHHLAEGRGRGRVVDVLEDDDGRAGQL